MDLNRVIGIIPARFASSRLPGKPLLKIGDWSVIRHVYERTRQLLPHVLVATDDEHIADEVRTFGGKVVMTSAKHQSGTDRIREALDIYEQEEHITFDYVINVQGDEPFVSLAHLDLVLAAFQDDTVDIATLVHPFSKEASYSEISNPNHVKVVRSSTGRALYFSRSVIPFMRNKVDVKYFKHIGLYAFRSDVLREVTQLPMGLLEQAEGLEQLRWLEAGFSIQTLETSQTSIGIDTEADLEKARAFYEQYAKVE